MTYRIAPKAFCSSALSLQPVHCFGLDSVSSFIYVFLQLSKTVLVSENLDFSFYFLNSSLRPHQNSFAYF